MQQDRGRPPTVAAKVATTVATKVARVAAGRTVLVVTALVGAVLVTGLTAAGAEVYEAVEEGDGIAGLDRPVLDEALAVRTPAAARLVTAFTHLGGPVGMTLIALALTVALVWRRRSWTPLLLMVLAAAGSLVFTTVGKAVVGRPRPPLTDAVPPYEHAFSFPSGHALNSTVIAGMVAYLAFPLLRHRWSRALSVAGAVVWAVAMGLSRVYLGHHWLTDVCFAWLLGLAWLALLVTAHRLFLLVHRARATGPPVSRHPRRTP